MIEDHKWPKEEAALMKALWQGTSDAHAQQRALKYIVEMLGGINQVPLEPGNPDITAFNSGRMWVARQLQIAISTPIDQLVTNEDKNERTQRGTRTATERAASKSAARRSAR